MNIHPNELDDSWLVRPDDPIFSHEHPVYLEITESVPLTHFRFCHGVLREVRGARRDASPSTISAPATRT